MKLILQENEWDCLAASVAMILDCSLKEVISNLDHDGSEILWPDLPEPKNHRSFTWQEMIPLFLSNLMYPVEIVRLSLHGYDEAHCLTHNNEAVIRAAMLKRPGILFMSEPDHAVAWCHYEQKYFDPAGFKSQLNDLTHVDSFVAVF